MHKLSEYSLEDTIKKALEHLHYETATEVQAACIPALLNNQNLIVKSPTGSGKTAAFAIPIANAIEWEENSPQALVIVPSRELAVQIAKDFNLIGRYKRLKAQSIFGKQPLKEQASILKQKNHVIVSTPGRLMDLILRGRINLSKLKFLVIDEADELLKHDFLAQMDLILDNIPKELTTALFSATLDENTLVLGRKIAPNHQVLDLGKETPPLISQHSLRLTEGEKERALITFLKNNGLRAIVFTITKLRSDKLCENLKKHGINATCIHSDLNQKQRLSNLQAFRENEYQVIVTTDLAARGLDIDFLPLVINYDLPPNPRNYTHRIGRTGRNTKLGLALNFISPNQEIFWKRIQEHLGISLDTDVLPSIEELYQVQSQQAQTTAKGADVGKDIVRLFIQGGKKQKLRAFDIVGTLTSIPEIFSEDIGIIEIKDNESFVEILNHKGDYALECLREKNIKGRKRKVHIAK